MPGWEACGREKRATNPKDEMAHWERRMREMARIGRLHREHVKDAAEFWENWEARERKESEERVRKWNAREERAALLNAYRRCSDSSERTSGSRRDFRCELF